ncbi:MAG: hypothetical protein J7K40_06905 [candidate division Zixibacteria bacterium]|nr:hypothetical protein [candidate division Zixibacteria bacterium]
MPGDINGNQIILASDVVYGVNYFRGKGMPPPDSCWNESAESWLYSAADANGDCKFMGSDITFMINYFKGNNPTILWCSQTPPPALDMIIRDNRYLM